MNTTRTHTEDIRNEIVFLSYAHVKTLPSKIIVVFSDSKDITITELKSNPEDEKYIVNAVVCDSELMDAIERSKQHTNSVIAYERSFYCLGCRNKGRENFSYQISTAHGEEHLCDNCSSIIVTSQKPTKL